MNWNTLMPVCLCTHHSECQGVFNEAITLEEDIVHPWWETGIGYVTKYNLTFFPPI